MMSCHEMQPMISWLLDDELDRAQSEEVQDHLNGCASCRQDLQNAGQLRQVLRRAAASIDTPVSLRHRIRETMQRERRSQTGLAKAWPAAVAAAILLSFVWHGTPEGRAPVGLSVSSAPLDDALPMDIVATDVGTVENYLLGKLPYAVHLPSMASPQQAEGQMRVAARIVQKNGHQAAYVRYELPHGNVRVVIDAAKDALLPQADVAHRPAATAGIGGAVSTAQPAGDSDRLLSVNRDARGLTVAQWRARGLAYDMVSDLPAPEILTLIMPMMH